MSKFKRWLCEKFLPEYARQALFEENQSLINEIESLEHRLELQIAYTNGLETALRYTKRVNIKNEIQK